MKLANKKAIVTGAGRGIGRAVAIAFAKEGADIIVNYQSNDAAAKETVEMITALGRKAIPCKADVSSYQAMKEMTDLCINELGGLDILVNNAGLSHPAMFLDMTEENWDRVIDVHLKGCFNCTQLAARYMKGQKSGKIINVISTAGLYGTVGQINYASAKGGIVTFTKSAARELGRYNITVNALCPGVTMTDMTEKIRTDEKFKEVFLNRINLHRFSEPEEIAPVFVFLACDDSSYVSGIVLNCDGGYIG